MIEVPVFIAYRRTDGSGVAGSLRECLQGRSVWVNETLTYLGTITAYFDQAQPAVPDWTKLQHEELQRARAFLLVCSPDAMHESTNDCLYEEIRWWLANRSSMTPILVTWMDERCIPAIVIRRWPKIQFLKVEGNSSNASASSTGQLLGDRTIQSILSSISLSIERASTGDSEALAKPFPSFNAAGFYWWQKDKWGRYINCNENYAYAAGCESPKDVIGKTDDDMPWSALAEFFRIGDRQVILGKGPPRTNVLEKEIMADRTADILVNEGPLLDQRRECLGVEGRYEDVTGMAGLLAGLPRQGLDPKPTTNNEEVRAYHLVVESTDVYLSEIEGEVIKGMLYRYTTDRIAGLLNVSRAAVESHIHSIKRKLQCVTDGDVIATAIKSGFPLLLFGGPIAHKPDLKG
jgi:DNA-binding CsgD family transcriptional regulator